jgi:hypothetical protein
MIRLLYSITILAWIGVGAILVQTFRARPVRDPILEEVYSSPGMAEQGKERRRLGVDQMDHSLSPLVVHAQAFATGINPPRPVKPSDGRMVRQSDSPPPRPVSPSVFFKVQAVSFYPGQPERSIALILDSGSLDGIGRWVKKDSRIGSWVVQEVRRGMVVVRDGQQVREVALDRSAIQRTLVKEVKSGSRVSLLQGPVSPSGSGGQK